MVKIEVKIYLLKVLKPKICLGIDQMYIERECDTESDDAKSAGAIEEAEEMVTGLGS